MQETKALVQGSGRNSLVAESTETSGELSDENIVAAEDGEKQGVSELTCRRKWQEREVEERREREQQRRGSKRMVAEDFWPKG